MFQKIKLTAIMIAAFLAISAPIRSLALTTTATTDDIQSKIDQRNADIQALQKEIQGYQTQLNALSGQESTLKDTVTSLNLTQKKLQADISLTQDKIDSTNLQIQQLTSKIGTTQSGIADDDRFVADSFKSMNETGSRSIPEVILASQSISDAWNAVNNLAMLETQLQARINSLLKAKTTLETNKKATEKARANLVTLQNQLKDQRAVVLANQADKNRLLSETKDSETAYQQILANKLAQEAAFQQDLLQFESQLKLTVDLKSLPPTGSAPLGWPLDNIFITQYFGNTPFATANPQIYSGAGHDGVDFRATVGTPVKAALSGIVIGEANTDLIPGCYSFGKWIMIKHDDGLSTLYAHLSLQTVSLGQAVTTGEMIGYSGNTGYTTGPHLHFGVYATAGVEIKPFTTSKHCQGAVIPLAVLPAYLNPLSYLPALH